MCNQTLCEMGFRYKAIVAKFHTKNVLRPVYSDTTQLDVELS